VRKETDPPPSTREEERNPGQMYTEKFPSESRNRICRKSAKAGDGRISLTHGQAPRADIRRARRYRARISPSRHGLRRNELKLPPFYLLGDRDSSVTGRRLSGLKLKVADVRAEEAPQNFRRRVAGRGHRHAATRGRASRPYQRGRSPWLDQAGRRRCSAGRAGAVVTNRLPRSVLYRAGFTPSRPYRVSCRARGDRRPRRNR